MFRRLVVYLFMVLRKFYSGIQHSMCGQIRKEGGEKMRKNVAVVMLALLLMVSCLLSVRRARAVMVDLQVEAFDYYCVGGETISPDATLRAWQECSVDAEFFLHDLAQSWFSDVSVASVNLIAGQSVPLGIAIEVPETVADGTYGMILEFDVDSSYWNRWIFYVHVNEEKMLGVVQERRNYDGWVSGDNLPETIMLPAYKYPIPFSVWVKNPTDSAQFVYFDWTMQMKGDPWVLEGTWDLPVGTLQPDEEVELSFPTILPTRFLQINWTYKFYVHTIDSGGDLTHDGLLEERVVEVESMCLSEQSEPVDVENINWWDGSPLVGDVNCDFKVDLEDLMICKRQLCPFSHDEWYAKCDLNMDGAVDGTDISLIAKHLGDTL